MSVPSSKDFQDKVHELNIVLAVLSNMAFDSDYASPRYSDRVMDNISSLQDSCKKLLCAIRTFEVKNVSSV